MNNMQNKDIVLKETIGQIRSSFFIRKIIALSLLVGSLIYLFLNKGQVLYSLLFTALIFLWTICVYLFDFLIKGQDNQETLQKINFIYVLFELIIIIFAVHYSGGIAWIGPAFYVFTLIYAFNYLSKGQAILINIFAIFLVLGLVFFEFFGILSHVNNFYFDLFRNKTYIFVTSLVFCCFLIVLGWTLHFFISLLRRRNSAVLKAYKDSAEMKASLEIRVAARKKELEELSSELQKNIAIKKQELEKRIKELEEFNKLVVQRELKIMSLKNKIKNK
jgi:hypothetical protein